MTRCKKIYMGSTKITVTDNLDNKANIELTRRHPLKPTPCCCNCCCRLSASFSGTVYDKASGSPLKEVLVSVRSGYFKQCKTTDNNGHFNFSLPYKYGTVSLSFVKPGFNSRYIGFYNIYSYSGNNFYLFR